MIRATFAGTLLFSSLAMAGDEFLMPELQAKSAYESTAREYRAVGIQMKDGEQTLYVVARPSEVLVQKSVNRIIRDARRRTPGLTRIMFYMSVHDKPAYPSFAIYEHLAVYVLKDNKTYFGPAAKDLYGGWVHGPKS